MMISDKQVWDALTAYEDEIREWRVFNRHDGCSVAVRDAVAPDYNPDYTVGRHATAYDAVISYQVTQNRETAERYIRWQAMKIALATVTKTDRSDKNETI